MNKTIFTIMKKELARFFRDRRMVFSTILLPGLMIFVMYTFMGTAFSSQTEEQENYRFRISVADLPQSIEKIAEAQNLELAVVEPSRADEVKKQVKDQEVDLFVLFPQNFDEETASYQVSSGEEAPNVEIYYNNASMHSQGAYDTMIQLLDNYEGTLTNKFDYNQGEKEYDMATREEEVGSVFSSLLPMLLTIFLFSGCMAVAPESIAGEKERGTIATLLITPAGRGNIAMGKIAALSLIALLSGASSAIGTILSLPKILEVGESGMNAGIYQWADYLLLTVIVLSTVLLLVTLISIISAFAKTVKEAQSYVTPLMFVVLLIGVTAMFGEGAQKEWFYYLIPVYNSVQNMVALFSFEVSGLHIVLACVSNLLYTLLGVYCLTRMFNNEKVMFSK